MKPQAHQYLLEIENYVPGKSKITNNSKKIIKLSSNENALGASPKALNSYIEHVQEVFRYADGASSNLRYALGQKNNINPEKIVCGAGSDEIISFLTSAFVGVDDEVIYSEHGFLMYPISAKRVGTKPIKVKEKNLKTDIHAILNAITKKTKIIFIANPNNPTGSYLNNSEILELIANVSKNILIVLDHAYQEFVNVNDYYDAIKIVDENPNVVLTRTFSKIYGLASLRVGWSYSSLEIAEILNKVRGPFNVSGPAQISALSALNDDNFVQESKNHNTKWLKIYQQELSKINKIKLYPSIANFVLIDFFNTENCQKANNKLLENSIIFREMNAYGLPSCLRATIGNDEENEIVLNIMNNICHGL
ncbi:MAG: histidinol-phosphate transaminase [Alphaproteobacteria bacterium]|nr:histidinol-phosphate transaminase [Alphaproteobacteria bacterium]